MILFLLTLLLTLSTTPIGAVQEMSPLEKTGTILGRLFVNDAPLDGATVAFFLTAKGLPPIGKGMRRVPEYLSKTDASGHFNLRVEVGAYYIGMLVRPPGAPSGPPRSNEPYYFAAGPDKQLLIATLTEKGPLDLGRLDGALPNMFKETGDTFAVDGLLVDAQGAPYADTLVFAKKSLEQTRPDFISERTLADGRFHLRLPANESFYLFARREISSSRPIPGDVMGIYGVKSETGLISPALVGSGGPPPGVASTGLPSSGQSAFSISGGQGEEISGITITMYKIPDAEEMKNSLQGSQGELLPGQESELKTIYFAAGSSILTDLAVNELNRWKNFLSGLPEVKIEITGHTDPVEGVDNTSILGGQRAEVVLRYLAEEGIDLARMVQKTAGSSHPVGDNTTEFGRERNRRVEIRLIGQ